MKYVVKGETDACVYLPFIAVMGTAIPDITDKEAVEAAEKSTCGTKPLTKRIQGDRRGWAAKGLAEN